MDCRRIGFIHTAVFFVELIKEELSRLSTKVEAFHIVDESLILDLMKVGRLNSGIIRRLCRLVISAEEAGADIITVTCSSISPAVDVARKLVSRPVLKIDEPMAEAAVRKGKRIGILATAATTLEPTTCLLKSKADERRKDVRISAFVCEGALEMLLRGDTEMHDRMVIDKARDVSRKVDVLVLAQGSMARLAPSLRKEIEIPILSSPRLFTKALESRIRESR
jgi:Asp/Glu/hydantoin racemase